MAYSDTQASVLIDLPADAPIQLFDLKTQQALIRPALEQRWIDILDHGRFIGGPEVTECEAKLAEFTGAADAVAVGSGTQALVMPLLAMGIAEGDAVFIPGFTYNATANAVLLSGGYPVIVDIDPDTFNMDPADLVRKIDAVKAEGKLTPRAIMPVDLYGLPADYSAIQAVADALMVHKLLAARTMGAGSAILLRSRRPVSTRPRHWAAMAMAARSSVRTRILLSACARSVGMAPATIAKSPFGLGLMAVAIPFSVQSCWKSSPCLMPNVNAASPLPPFIPNVWKGLSVSKRRWKARRMATACSRSVCRAGQRSAPSYQTQAFRAASITIWRSIRCRLLRISQNRAACRSARRRP